MLEAQEAAGAFSKAAKTFSVWLALPADGFSVSNRSAPSSDMGV